MLLGYLWGVLGYRPCPPLRYRPLPDVRWDRPEDNEAALQRREHMAGVYQRLQEKRNATQAR